MTDLSLKSLSLKLSDRQNTEPGWVSNGFWRKDDQNY